MSNENKRTVEEWFSLIESLTHHLELYDNVLTPETAEAIATDLVVDGWVTDWPAGSKED